jgi:hypothetical protein
MHSQEKTWDKLKAEYLRQVQKALASVKRPRIGQVIEDVRSHLDRRHAELEPGQRTWQNFQEIIAEMGPASDYAVLLAQDGAAPRRKVWPRYLFGMGLAAVVIATILLLPPAISGRLGKDRIVDEIDYPFVNDPELIGKWMSVDFVKEMDDFNPNAKHYRGRLYLKELSILENGRTAGPWTWTKGLIIHPADKTAAGYHIKEIDGSTYMFFEWKSGDYSIRRMKPGYYVLRKEQSDGN